MATSKGLVARVLLKRVGANWYAIGLEHAVVAWSEDLFGVFEKFNRCLAAEMAYGMRHGDTDNLLSGVRPAPKDIWNEYEEGTDCGMIPEITVIADAATAETAELSFPLEPLEVRLATVA